MHIQPLCGCVAIYKSSLNRLVDCRVPIFVIVKLIDYFWITWNAPPTVYEICVYNFVCHQCDSDCNWWTCIPVLMAIFPVDLDKPQLWLIGRWAEYCDEHFCLSVCKCISRTMYTRSDSTGSTTDLTPWCIMKLTHRGAVLHRLASSSRFMQSLISVVSWRVNIECVIGVTEQHRAANGSGR